MSGQYAPSQPNSAFHRWSDKPHLSLRDGFWVCASMHHLTFQTTFRGAFLVWVATERNRIAIASMESAS